MTLRPILLLACLGLFGCTTPSSDTTSPTTMDGPGPIEADPDAAESSEPAELADPTSESIGGIGIGASAAAVEAAFGPPNTKGEVIEWEATGDRTSKWTWSGKGLVLEMAEGAEGFRVHSITVEGPCEATTSRGVGIGTPFATVDSTYREFRGQGLPEGEGEQWGETKILVGSIFGGTFFYFEGGKLVSIFIGAAAE